MPLLPPGLYEIRAGAEGFWIAASRDFTQILSLSPGTATFLPDSTASGRNSQAVSVNGARVTQNNIQVNGVDTNAMGTNGPILVAAPVPETIEEFKV